MPTLAAGSPALFLALLLAIHSFSPAQTLTPQLEEATEARLIVQRRRVVLVRPASVVKEFPERRTATVVYPVVSGLRNPTVLRKVHSLLSFKNIFDYSLAEYRNDPWLTAFTYRVNYNANHIFDITFIQSGAAAYPDTQTRHIAIDLRRGVFIKAADVFQPSKLKSLASLVNQKLQLELKQVARRVKADVELDKSQSSSIVEALDDMKFEVTNLDDFSVGPNGLTFLFDAGFPHVIEVFEPKVVTSSPGPSSGLTSIVKVCWGNS